MQYEKVEKNFNNFFINIVNTLLGSDYFDKSNEYVSNTRNIIILYLKTVYFIILFETVFLLIATLF